MLGLGIIASTNVLAQTFYQCMPCPAGSYASGGKCVKCPEEKIFMECTGFLCELYSGSENTCKSKSSCTPVYADVNVGYVVNAEKTGCMQCPNGTGLDDTTKTCMTCLPGTYSKKGRCFPCPAGQYQDKSGQTSCIKCPDGQYANNLHTACSTCPKGNKCTNGIKAECQNGYYQPHTGATSCIECPSTRFYRGYGKTIHKLNVCNTCGLKFNTTYTCSWGSSNHYCTTYTTSNFWNQDYMGDATVGHNNKFQLTCNKITGQRCLEELNGRKRCY